jgi:hypothetical protein
MKMRRKIGSVCMAAAGLALAGCGGSDSTPAPAPAPAPPPPSVTIAGTAVQGAALGGAAVSVKCGTGTGATTTAASGAYTVTITGGALPCVVKAVGTGATYHSLVAGTGSTGTFTANVSPLTEMVVSHVGATDPATFFSAFSSTSTVPATSVTAANSYVETAMAGLTSLAGVNSLTDTLVVGNALDQKIDSVVAGITAAGLTVADVTASIVQNPAAPSVVAAPLATSAADCAWLKSGKYRLISRNEAVPEDRFGTVQINATALTVAADELLTMTSDGSCQFNINVTDGTVKVLASSGGMLVVHFQSKTVASDREVLIGVPEQALPVAELAGTWNVAAWLPANINKAGTAAAANAEYTADATGQITAFKGCVGLFACVPRIAPFGKFVTNPSGGFDALDGNGVVVNRVFLYKTLAGRKVAVVLGTDNTLSISVPMNPLPALPAVGTVNSFRSLQINGDPADSVSTLTEDAQTITATDSIAKTVTRLRTSDNRVDMLTYDKPRDGLRYRAGNSCTINNVLTVPPCAEVVQLPLRGMGITMTLSAVPQPPPGSQFYQFSVDKP